MANLLPTSPYFIENHPEISYTDTQKYNSKKTIITKKEKGYRYEYL